MSCWKFWTWTNIIQCFFQVVKFRTCKSSNSRAFSVLVLIFPGTKSKAAGRNINTWAGSQFSWADARFPFFLRKLLSGMEKSQTQTLLRWSVCLHKGWKQIFPFHKAFLSQMVSSFPFIPALHARAQYWFSRWRPPRANSRDESRRRRFCRANVNISHPLSQPSAWNLIIIRHWLTRRWLITRRKCNIFSLVAAKMWRTSAALPPINPISKATALGVAQKTLSERRAVYDGRFNLLFQERRINFGAKSSQVARKPCQNLEAIDGETASSELLLSSVFFLQIFPPRKTTFCVWFWEWVLYNGVWLQNKVHIFYTKLAIGAIQVKGIPFRLNKICVLWHK